MHVLTSWYGVVTFVSVKKGEGVPNSDHLFRSESNTCLKNALACNRAYAVWCHLAADVVCGHQFWKKMCIASTRYVATFLSHEHITGDGRVAVRVTAFLWPGSGLVGWKISAVMVFGQLEEVR